MGNAQTMIGTLKVTICQGLTQSLRSNDTLTINLYRINDCKIIL